MLLLKLIFQFNKFLYNQVGKCIIHYLYELLISEKVSFKQVARIISSYTKIPYEKIGTNDEYLNKLEKTNEFQIGIDIYFYDRGYKTFIDVIHPGFELKNSQLIELVCELAIGLKSNIAFSQMPELREFGYLIISPDKKYQKAYGIQRRENNEEDEITEFTVYKERADLSEYLSILDDE